MNVFVIEATDTRGYTVSVCFDGWSDTIHVQGLHDPFGGFVSFESEAYHFGTWAFDQKVQYLVHSLKLDLKARSVESWKVE